MDSLERESELPLEERIDRQIERIDGFEKEAGKLMQELGIPWSPSEITTEDLRDLERSDPDKTRYSEEDLLAMESLTDDRLMGILDVISTPLALAMVGEWKVQLLRYKLSLSKGK